MIWLCLALNLNSFGCDTLAVQGARLERFVKQYRYGTGADTWLVKRNAFGELEKVGLIFGFTDDFAFCVDIAALYMRKYPSETYLCLPQY